MAREKTRFSQKKNLKCQFYNWIFNILKTHKISRFIKIANNQKHYDLQNSKKDSYIIIVKTSKKVLKNAQSSFLESNNLSLKAMKTKEVLQQRQCENWGELSLSSNKSESLLDAFVLEENGLDIAFQDIEQAWEKYELLKLSI